MTQRITQWAEPFGYEIIAAEQMPDNPGPKGPTVVRLKDLFTTLDGAWDLSNQGQPGCIEPWALAEYNTADFDDRGAATSLFCLLLNMDGSKNKSTQFGFWSGGLNQIAGFNWQSKPDWLVIATVKPQSGWANLYMEHSSGYTPPNLGPWTTKHAPGWSDGVTNLGLYLSHHISTFMVFQEAPWTPTDPGGGGSTVDLSAVVAAINALNATLREGLRLP